MNQAKVHMRTKGQGIARQRKVQHEKVPKRVKLSCGGSGGGPGIAWDASISFIGDDKSYRMLTTGDESGNPVLLKCSAKPLSWRRMVADIQKNDSVGLGGTLLNDVDVKGLKGWHALILKLAWCKFDRLDESQFKFLLKAKDVTIASLNKGLDTAQPEDALSALGTVIRYAESLCIADAVVERAMQELVSLPGKDVETWLSAMETWLENHQPIGPSLRKVARPLSAEELANLVGGPSPNDSKVAALLLRKWASVNPKPILERNIRDGKVNSALSFLEWVVERVGSEALRSLEREDADMAKYIAEEVVSLAKSEIEHYKVRPDRGALEERRYFSAISSGLIGAWRQLQIQLLGERAVISNSSAD